MLWVGGFPVTVPTDNALAAGSPYVLKAEDDGYAIYRDGGRLAEATTQRGHASTTSRTADGIPYWKIALLHLDSFASTVVQTCSYWGNADQCKFCGIGLSLAAGRTTVKKTPEQLAEVAVAAKKLDGAVDATLTTGSSNGVDRGARYVARCGQAVKEAPDLPVEVQFEPPANLDVLDEVGDMGIDSVGIHVESFDPKVLAHVAPGKARTGIERYFEVWERAVEIFGEGQVSTYVILGMGEDPELTVEGCRRAIDIGVYPFVVPLRPVAGSLMEDVVPPDRAYTDRIYRRVAQPHDERGMDSSVPSPAARAARPARACAPLKPVLQIAAPSDRAVSAATSTVPGLITWRAGTVSAAPPAIADHHAIRHQVFVVEQAIFAGSTETTRMTTTGCDTPARPLRGHPGRQRAALRVGAGPLAGRSPGCAAAVPDPRCRRPIGAVRGRNGRGARRVDDDRAHPAAERRVLHPARLGPDGEVEIYAGRPHQPMAITLPGVSGRPRIARDLRDGIRRG